MELGIIRFLPAESFHNPNRGLDRGVRLERFLKELEPIEELLNPPPLSEWPRVKQAIYRNHAEYIVETSTPTFSAMLRFFPKAADKGVYEIHRKPPHGGIEKGYTTEVFEIPAGFRYPILSALLPYTARYLVFTLSIIAPKKRLAWLIGLNSFQEVDEASEAPA
jgi:hypothetical protein